MRGAILSCLNCKLTKPNRSWTGISHWYHQRELILNDDLRKLVRRCLEGDQVAMVDLVDRFKGQVYGLCYRMLNHQQDAEDVTQETMVRVLKNLHRWDPTRDFTPWLLAIAGNRCRTCLAKRMRKPPMQHLEQPVPDKPSNNNDGQLQEEVDLALGQIRQEYGEAFRHFHEGGLSYGEIAAAMEVPLGTVKTWVHRARREIIGHLVRRGIVEDTKYEVRAV